jgi:integrase
MSVEKRVLASGQVTWRTRWREGGRNHARHFDRKRDAQAFDAEIRRRRRLGELDLLDAGKQTLDDFAREWWRLYAEPNLARSTKNYYAALWDKHVLPRLGGMRLRQLSPQVVDSFAAELRKAGVGDPTIRKTLSVLQSVLGRAVVWRYIAVNPVAAVKKPTQRRARAVQPFAPASVEKVRAHLLQSNRLGDATLVSVLAYAGLRPGEALALRWGNLRGRTLVVERAIALGEEKDTKNRRNRSVRLLDAVATDLAEWRLASGRPGDGALVFPNRRGTAWDDFDWRNWRKRVFGPAAKAAGFTGVRPYDLRHSFVSLLIAEGKSVVEVAQQAGHSPTMTLNTYGHVLEELAGSKRRSANTVIRGARRPAQVRAAG